VKGAQTRGYIRLPPLTPAFVAPPVNSPDVEAASANSSSPYQPKEVPMMKSLPDGMFRNQEQSRLSALRAWVLENGVTEIGMNEQQFWNFAQLQPLAEKPWTTFMGRMIRVADMPVDAQKQLGIFDSRSPGAI
jgi:hypothetical protein